MPSHLFYFDKGLGVHSDCIDGFFLDSSNSWAFALISTWYFSASINSFVKIVTNLYGRWIDSSE